MHACFKTSWKNEVSEEVVQGPFKGPILLEIDALDALYPGGMLNT